MNRSETLRTIMFVCVCVCIYIYMCVCVCVCVCTYVYTVHKHVLYLVCTINMRSEVLKYITNLSSLLHRAFRRITLIIDQKMHYIKFHIKTLKIALTCFDPKIILMELRCSC